MSTNNADKSTIVLPGQPLAPAATHNLGTGVHVHNGQIIASLVGQVIISTTVQPATTASSTKQGTTTTTANASKSSSPPCTTTISVVKPTIRSDEEANTTLLPDVNSEVMARVTRIGTRQATVAIFVIGDRICGDEFQGVIRSQDVRATEVDKVKIFTSFRPGDIVRARVISLGDQSNYYLTTASNHLGVIMANSEAGDPMYPINWKEMKSTRTGVVEERKVAKPF